MTTKRTALLVAAALSFGAEPALSAAPEAITDYMAVARAQLMMCALQGKLAAILPDEREKQASLAEVRACQTKAAGETRTRHKKALVASKKPAVTKMLSEFNDVYLGMLAVIPPKPGESAEAHNLRMNMNDALLGTMQTRVSLEY